MTHLMDMSLSVTGWSIEPELLAGIAVELLHSEQFGDSLRLKLAFKDGHEAMIEGDLKDGVGRGVHNALQREIGTKW